MKPADRVIGCYKSLWARTFQSTPIFLDEGNQNAVLVARLTEFIGLMLRLRTEFERRSDTFSTRRRVSSH